MIEDRIVNYLASCGLQVHYGQTQCIAKDGKIVHMGYEPTVSLIKSILDLSDQIEHIRNHYITTGNSE